jgi:hypothetical protein
MQPADFAPQVTTAVTYAGEEVIAIAETFLALGSTPAYLSDLESAPGVTQVASGGPATNVIANGFQSIPAALMILGMASFDNQPNPSDANGQITAAFFAAQANAVSSIFGNMVFNNTPDNAPPPTLFCTD